MSTILAITWPEILGIAAFAWSVLVLLSCVIAGHFKDHPSIRPADKPEDENK